MCDFVIHLVWRKRDLKKIKSLFLVERKEIEERLATVLGMCLLSG